MADERIAAIRARLKAATPGYTINWDRGRHALLQDRGCNSNPRTIAEFDKDSGYADLAFCANAPSDLSYLLSLIDAMERAAG